MSCARIVATLREEGGTRKVLALTLAFTALISLGLPRLAAGQERLSLERLAEAICEKADADGDSYRPKVCQPRCDCLEDLLGLPGIQVTSCMETDPETFEIGMSVPQRCGDVPEWQNSCLGGTCNGPEDCSSPYVCFNGFPQGLCLLSCSPGEICPGGFATPSSVTLVPVEPVTSAAVVMCTETSTSTPINTQDANECLNQVEAVSGLTCGHRCGNGVLDAGEGCDDGNTTPGDGCNASCALEP